MSSSTNWTCATRGCGRANPRRSGSWWRRWPRSASRYRWWSCAARDPSGSCWWTATSACARCAGSGATALEQGWLLHELAVRFALALEDLGRRFARSASWVSRRLALVEELPETIQEHVRRGELPAHAAMKHLVPLARANPEACERLVAAIAGKGLTNRQIGQLYAVWRDGVPAIRERVLTAPLLLLKARQALGTVPEDEGRLLMDDLDMLAAVARRARRRLRQGVFRRLLPPERQEVHRLGAAADDEIARLAERLREEKADAGAIGPAGDP